MDQIWTVGHWTHSEGAFTTLLRGEDVAGVADVRAHPGSRSSPQFAGDAMPEWLGPEGIGYRHLPLLGGRRPKQDVSSTANVGWQNASFKNYADYTLTAPYEEGIAVLTDLAAHARTVVMCAEPMPWRCHRLLISNTLAARGWTVRHIMADGRIHVHELGQWGAEPVADDRGNLRYPGPPGAGDGRAV